MVDQAHRGYNMADDVSGFKSVNPLFMKVLPPYIHTNIHPNHLFLNLIQYTPSDGKFAGQLGYGYRYLPLLTLLLILLLLILLVTPSTATATTVMLSCLLLLL